MDAVPPTPTRPAAARLLGLGLLLVVGALVAQVLGALVGTAVSAALGNANPSADDLTHIRWPSGAIAFIGGELAIFAVGATYAVRRVGSLAAVGLRTAGAGRSLLATAPILAIAVVLPLLASIGSADGLFAAGDDAPRVLLLAVATITIGLAEETVFRGALFDLLGARDRPVLAVAGCALLFGVVHLPFTDPGDTGSIVNAVAVLFVVGLPFAVIRLVTDNIAGLVVAHALFDFVGLLRLGSVSFDKPTLAAAIWSIASSAIVGGCYVLWGRSAWRNGRLAPRLSPAAPTND